MTTKRKQKSYSFNPFDHTFLGGNLEFNPRGALSAWDQDRKEKRELEVIKGLIAKQKAKEASPEEQNKRLGILEHDEGGEYTDEENAVLLKIAKATEGDSTDFETVRVEPQFEGTYDADQEAFDDEYYSGHIASEEDLDKYELEGQYAQYRNPDNSVDTSMISKDSSKSKMTPKQKVAMIGLLKDFMTPQQDDPVPQIRGAGIIRGGGTPFPSLLAKRQKPPRYTPKGLI